MSTIKHWSGEGTGEIETPFLGEGLFVGEFEEELEPRVTAIVAASPYLNSLEGLETGPRFSTMPQAHEEETKKWEPPEFEEKEYEYEEGTGGEHGVHALEEESVPVDDPEFRELYPESGFHPESNRFDDSEVGAELTADAFVSDSYSKKYFFTFPRLGDLAVQKVTVLTPRNFENLMDLILASNQNNFVIDAHGSPLGFFMPLASATRIPATKVALFILRGVEHVQSLSRIAKQSETIWTRAAGMDLNPWRRIVEVLHSKTWQQMLGSAWPPAAPRVSSVVEAKRTIQSRIDALVDSLFPGKVANKQEQVDRLIKKMLRLQAKGIREIQIRACNVGKDSNSLYEFRKFFGTDHLCAPDVRTGIGLSDPPSINRQVVDRLVQDHRTRLFNMPSGRFAIRVIFSGSSFSVNCAADTQVTVREWIANHIMAKHSYRSGTLPIHFLETQPLAFPLDRDYARHIQCRSSFWEGVVRRGKEAPTDEELETIAQEKELNSTGEIFESDFQKESNELDGEDELEFRWFEKRSDKIGESGEEMFESRSALAIKDEFHSEPEEYVQEAPHRSSLRIPEGVEWPEEAEDWLDEAGHGFTGNFEHEEPTKKIEEALERKDWNKALQYAIQAGERDVRKLTNLVFFAQHKELDQNRKLDPKTNKTDQKLAREWVTIRNSIVWTAIERSAKNSALAVHGNDVAGSHRLFWRSGGGEFKKLVEWAAQEVNLNPGLLATALVAETGEIATYLTKSKVNSYYVGLDDFFDLRHVLAKTVTAFAKIGWDKKQKPLLHLNDALKKQREVKTIQFNTGRDAVLATAVYLKFGEVYLREKAKKAGGDFDKLPVEIRFALTRTAQAAGRSAAAKLLEKALKGKDVLIRNWKPAKAYHTRRNATIRAAQALHLADWIFGIPTSQPEIDESENWIEEQEGRNDLAPNDELE